MVQWRRARLREKRRGRGARVVGWWRKWRISAEEKRFWSVYMVLRDVMEEGSPGRVGRHTYSPVRTVAFSFLLEKR